MTFKVPGYVVETLIGYGASSSVWRARAVRSDYPVALKRIPAAAVEEAAAARSEAALLATLDHPHLIRLHELITTADAVVLVLDLADAGSLAALLAARDRITPGEVAGALAPVGAALAYTHNEGIIHGDVSAGNVLFTRIGLPLLGDLGLARIQGDAGPAYGTPAYVDPLVARGCVAGTQSDVFSLGAVALHALTGTALWPGVSAQAQLDAAARCGHAELAELLARLADLPAPLSRVLRGALQLDPQRRCTAAEFALDLRHCVTPERIELTAGRPRPDPSTGQPGQAGQPGPVSPPAGPGRHRRQPAGMAPQRPGEQPGRPRFDRPGAAIDRGQLTHGVRIAPRPPDRSRCWRRLPGRRVSAVVSVALLAAGGTLGWWFWPARQPTARAVSPILQRLDSLREQAFARDDATLLEQVYVPGPLLEQDKAALRAIVAPGCGLLGLRTTFSEVRETMHAKDRIEVTVSASLSPSRLVCGTRTVSSTSGTPASRLSIELSVAGTAYRVASQRVAAG